MQPRLILICLRSGAPAERTAAALRRNLGAAEIVRIDIPSSGAGRRETGSAAASSSAVTDRPFNADDFAARLGTALQTHRLRRGDRLVFDHCAFTTLESLSEVTLRLGLSQPFDVDAFFVMSASGLASGSRDEGQISHPETLRWRLQSGSPFQRLHLLAESAEVAEAAADRLGLPVRLLGDQEADDAAIDRLGGKAGLQDRRSRIQAALMAGSVSVTLLTDGSGDGDIATETRRFLEAHGLTVQSFDLREVADPGGSGDLAATLADATIAVNALGDLDHAVKLDRLCALLRVPTVRLESEPTSVAFHGIIADRSSFATSMLEAIRALRRDTRSSSRVPGFGDGAFDRRSYSDLVGAPDPSLVVERLGPKAAVIMPMWGRCGSSYAMEAHVRFLSEQGFFVHQILIADKEIGVAEGAHYLRAMLAENSVNTRGNVQRIAHTGYGRGTAPNQLIGADGLTQLLERVAGQKLNDAAFEASLRACVLTIVNHVFHVFWARRWASGRMILETHDIQTYQCARWPLNNEVTGAAETVEAMLAAEKAIVASLDYVVNVAPEEHAVLSEVNPKSRLVTPYVPERELTARFASVSDMAKQMNWHSSFHEVDKFDLFLAGDSHFANQEAGIWFIGDVFLPHLSHRNVNLVICGRLNQVLWEKFGEQPNIFYLGFVDDIVSVRALSKLAVLIDTRGTGISIKTLETLSSGQPFVGTTVAFRGLRDRLPSEVQGYDQPKEFAAKVLDVLQSGFEYERLRGLAKRSYQAVASKGLFDDNWSAILQDVGVSHHVNTRDAYHSDRDRVPMMLSGLGDLGRRIVSVFQRFINIR